MYNISNLIVYIMAWSNMLNYTYSGAKLLKSYPAFKRALTWQIMSASQHEQNKGILPTHFLRFMIKYYPLNRILIHANFTPLPSPPIHNSLSLYHHCIQAGHLQSICHLSHLCSSVLSSKEWGDGGTISTVFLGSTDTNSKCSKPTEALDTACVYT